MLLSENAIQQQAVMWFRFNYSGMIIYHIPNENQHRKTNIGVLAGIPDLHIPHKSGEYNSLYIEMKTDKGKLSEKQIKIHTKLKDACNAVEVCRSLEEFKEVVNNYFNLNIKQ
jgi:hypothetical protein